MRYFFLFILLLLSGCSTVQYNYTPTSFTYHAIRYGMKEQSIILVVPIIQDNTKNKGSRTILDTRIDITTSTITGLGSSKNIRYIMPNGFILGFKYKF